MSIVLAIEPDRRQAAHLIAIARHLVDAELVLADTTEGALDAIGNRVPDLVLVPALLSPQDDAALAAALKVIAAAAHVRTLTIPVLANGTQPQPSGGMLSKWRKSRAASPEPDGCDPAVFAEQISTYLKEAAAARAELAGDAFEEAPAAFVASIHGVRATPITADPAIQQYAAAPGWDADLEDVEPVLIEVEPLAIESSALAEQPWADTPQPWAEQQPIAVAAEAGGATGEAPDIDLSDELADLSQEEDAGELFDGERIGVYTISVELEEPAIAAFDLLPRVMESAVVVHAISDLIDDADAADPIARIGAPPDAALERRSEEPWFDAPVAALPVSVEPVFTESMRAAPIAAGPALVAWSEPVRADIEPWVPMYLSPGRMWPTLEGMPAEMPMARTEQPDWIELVASLRQDLERRRTDPPSAAADPVAARPSDGGEAETRRLVKKQKAPAKKPRPVQDEWGFFDPEQCGFSTLLAKLDEITEDLSGA